MRIEDLHFEGILGQGANATVYGVQHAPTGLSAALKVAAVESARGRTRFLTEARALATLDHARIVNVWDLGVGDGRHPWLPEGAPYLLMEKGVGVLEPDSFGSWGQLRAALIDVLRGLAHLHGHGFVHRDIKPANLLRFPDGYKVGDLGIVTDTLAPLVDGIAGSPMSMAPEQILGDARDLGPHTDLYGLGATAWRVATGTWPFYDFRAIPVAPLVDPLPTFTPRFEVPAGFETWLGHLLVRDPHSRFWSAAHALDALPSETGGATSSVQPGPLQPPLHTLDLETLEFTASSPAPEGGMAYRPLKLPPREPRSHTVLPFHTDGLWGLRPLPMVGRDEACDQIWAVAREVVDQGILKVVVLQGPHGSGRTRLAQWAGSSLHAAIGSTFVTLPDAGGRLGPTLEYALSKGFRLVGLSPNEQHERLRRVLQRGPLSNPADQNELLRMLGFDEDAPPMDEASRTRLVSLAIAHAGRVVVLLDDVSSACPSVADLLSLLEREPATPALVMVTASETEDLSTLLAHPATLRIELGDLPPGAFGELSNLMGLSSAETTRADLFASRTPAMARAVFTPVQEPTDLPAEQAQALGLASVLGHTFEHRRWQQAAQAAGLPEDGLAFAIDAGILRPSGDALYFDSPLFQSAVSPRGELAIRLHKAAMEAYDPHIDPVPFGLHALDADLPELAVEPLQEGLRLAKSAGAVARVTSMTRVLLNALERSGSDDLALAEHYVRLARHGAWACPRDEAAALTRRAVEACRHAPASLRLRAYYNGTQSHVSSSQAARMCHGWARTDPELKAELMVRASVMELLSGNLSRARSLLKGMDPESLHPDAREHYWRGLSELHWQQGRLDDAEQACLKAIALAPDPERCPSATSLGYVLLEKGDLDGAERYFREVVTAMLSQGLPLSTTDSLAGLGKVHERRGEYERAADLWVEVARMLLVRGSVHAAASIADLSLLYAKVGRLDHARMAARQAASVALAHDNQVWEFVAAVTLLASIEAPEEWKPAIQNARRLAKSTDFHDPDLLRALHLARSRCPPDHWRKIDGLIDRLSATQ